MLAIEKFSNGRRVMLDGRSMLAFDFVGDPDAKTHGLAEDACKKLSGTIWIDEQDRQVRRLEARLNDGYKLGFGLFSLSKGSSFVFDQKLVNNELWLPTSASIHVEARAAGLLNYRANIRMVDDEYHRLHADAQQKDGRDGRPLRAARPRWLRAAPAARGGLRSLADRGSSRDAGLTAAAAAAGPCSPPGPRCIALLLLLAVHHFLELRLLLVIQEGGRSLECSVLVKRLHLRHLVFARGALVLVQLHHLLTPGFEDRLDLGLLVGGKVERPGQVFQLHFRRHWPMVAHALAHRRGWALLLHTARRGCLGKA